MVGDTNGQHDVFLHDRQTGEPAMLSVSSGGTQGNDWSVWSSISSGGCYTAFHSIATNLVPLDTNGSVDVFVRGHTTGETMRVSVASDGTQGNQWSIRPRIVSDGQLVVFSCDASNLVSSDTNSARDVFVATNPLFDGVGDACAGLAVGGVAEPPDVDATGLPTKDSTGARASLLAGIAGAIATAVVAVGAMWYVRRRLQNRPTR